MTTLYQLLVVALPFIGLFLPGLLKQNAVAPQYNGLIATGIVLAFSALQAWCAGKLGTNPYFDFIAVAGTMSILLAGPFKPVDLFIQSNFGLGVTKLPPIPVVVPEVQSTTPVEQAGPAVMAYLTDQVRAQNGAGATTPTAVVPTVQGVPTKDLGQPKA